jgi:hypothetical protein
MVAPLEAHRPFPHVFRGKSRDRSLCFKSISTAHIFVESRILGGKGPIFVGEVYCKGSEVYNKVEIPVGNFKIVISRNFKKFLDISRATLEISNGGTGLQTTICIVGIDRSRVAALLTL